MVLIREIWYNNNRAARSRPNSAQKKRSLHMNPVIESIDNSRRYKAAIRTLDGVDIRVYSTADHPSSHYGLQVWCDKEGNAYGQINLRHPFYVVHAVEEITEEEAKSFEKRYM